MVKSQALAWLEGTGMAQPEAAAWDPPGGTAAAALVAQLQVTSLGECP